MDHMTGMAGLAGSVVGEARHMLFFFSMMIENETGQETLAVHWKTLRSQGVGKDVL